MSGFAQNLLERHAGTVPVVRPRTRGLFEPVSRQSLFSGPALSESTEFAGEPTSVGSFNPAHAPAAAPRFPIAMPANKPFFSEKTAGAAPENKMGYLYEKLAPTVPPMPEYLQRETRSDQTQTSSSHRNNRRDEQDQLPLTANLRAREQDVSPSTVKNSGLPETNVSTGVSKVLPVVSVPNTSGSDKSWMQQIKAAADAYLPPPAPNVIKVHIGRLEIRTGAPSTPPPPVKSSPPPKPRLSLEEYLNKQKK